MLNLLWLNSAMYGRCLNSKQAHTMILFESISLWNKESTSEFINLTFKDQ